TWSAWSTPVSAAEGNINVPAARYVQWKVTSPKPSPATAIDTVSVAFLNRNVAPAIESVTVQDPAVVYITGSYPPSPQVVEATNPDEYGIFTSLDTPRDKNEPGKKVFRKGFRTVIWRARDENGDSLRHSVSFRRKGEYSADAQKWIRMIPVDGIADSPSETYRLERSALAGKFVIVRAVDTYYNVATESIPLP